MKVGFLLDVYKFFKDDVKEGNYVSYVKLVDFMIYLKNRYYPYMSLNEIFRSIFPKEYSVYSLLSSKELLSLLELYKEEINKGDLQKIKIYEEILEELERREYSEKNKGNFELLLYKILIYLNRTAKVNYRDILEMDIKTLEEVLKDDEISRLTTNTTGLFDNAVF